MIDHGSNNTEKRVALTGFMGVGKSSVARHLASILKCERIDLDAFIEKNTGRTIADIFTSDGEPAYREIETQNLIRVLNETSARIISLGGGTWTLERNRGLIAEKKIISIWLESSFDHCWANISKSRKERPLAKNKEAARALFDTRKSVYCLADWHFIVRRGLNSYDIALEIAEQVFS